MKQVSVPFADLYVQYLIIKPEIDAVIEEGIKSSGLTWISTIETTIYDGCV